MQRGFAPARALRDDVVSDLNLDSFQQRDAYSAPALKFVALTGEMLDLRLPSRPHTVSVH